MATLDDQFMAKSVVVKHGRDTYEFTYSDYNDYNNELNRIESQYAGKMVERDNGKVVRDIEDGGDGNGQRVRRRARAPERRSHGAAADVRQRPESPRCSLPPLRRRVWRAASPI